METPIYIALSRQRVLMHQLEIVANNVANASTSGYKADRMTFAEHVTKARGTQPISQVREIGTYRELGDGAVIRTGNAFDLALNGPGYFVINTPQGERYTRNGGFTLDPTGQLVTSWGAEVQGQGGAIAVPPGDTEINIASDGAVSTRESGTVGRLRLVVFEDEQRLRKIANGLYATDAAAQDAAAGDVRVVQGAIEGSNVNPITEIARMIKIQRHFEAVQRIIEQEHRRQRDGINKIFRAP